MPVRRRGALKPLTFRRFVGGDALLDAHIKYRYHRFGRRMSTRRNISPRMGNDTSCSLPRGNLHLVATAFACWNSAGCFFFSALMLGRRLTPYECNPSVPFDDSAGLSIWIPPTTYFTPTEGKPRWWYSLLQTFTDNVRAVVLGGPAVVVSWVVATQSILANGGYREQYIIVGYQVRSKLINGGYKVNLPMMLLLAFPPLCLRFPVYHTPTC